MKKLFKEIKKHFPRAYKKDFETIHIPTKVRKKYLVLLYYYKEGQFTVYEPSAAKKYTHINKIDYIGGNFYKKPRFRFKETQKLYDTLKDYIVSNSVKFINSL